MDYKVKVQHRSDILMEEQIEMVKNMQEALHQSILQFEKAQCEDEHKFHSRQVNDLKIKNDEMMLTLQVVHKINVELEFSRNELKKALKTNADVNLARKRVGWLEDRMETLLGRKRIKSSGRVNMRSDPRMMRSEDMQSSDLPLGLDGAEGFITNSPHISSFRQGTSRTEEGKSSLLGTASHGEAQDKDMLQKDPTTRNLASEEEETQIMDKSIGEQCDVVIKPNSQTTTSSTASSPASREMTMDVEKPSSTKKRTKVPATVTIKLPPAKDDLDDDGESSSSSVDYWESEHHRFEYSEYAGILCQANPLSYHQMGLAVPGSFVKEVDSKPSLPWRPKRKGSDVSDVHKVALDMLEKRVHRMYKKVHDATMLSVQPAAHDNIGTSIMNQFGSTSSNKWKKAMDLVSKDTSRKPAKPTGTSDIMDNAGIHDSLVFPSLERNRLGSSTSGRLVYYPKPLPYPPKLPIRRTDREKEYPRQPDVFLSQPSETMKPPKRFVDQRNLLKETEFTSSLYHAKPSRHSPTASERRFQRMLLGETPSSIGSAQKKPIQRLKATFQTAKTVFVIKGNKWKEMKPKSGALEHSGLKWERVKSIVNESLVSQHEEERIGAARLLGALRCADAMVTFSLKESLRNDEVDRVQYEACKSLITLGCWEDEVVGRVVKFMLHGNSDIIADMLKTLINGKNVQFVDKKMPSFRDLSLLLSDLCELDNVNENIALNAAITLGKLCVADEKAKHRLRQVLNDKNPHVRAEAVEILARQLHYMGWDLIEAVLYQLNKSPIWKHRKNAAKLLILLGKKHVLVDNKNEEIFALLNRRLWDDPNKQVRQEVARSMAALDMFARACEKSEQCLENPKEEIRAQAIISIGTLGMKNERILRVLLEMIELDTSEYVRLMIIRTLIVLNSQDKRVLRALRDKERGEGPLAREAKKALDILSRVSTAPNSARKA